MKAPVTLRYLSPLDDLSIVLQGGVDQSSQRSCLARKGNVAIPE